MSDVQPWSKRKRDRRLAVARWLDRLAARIRADVKAHTPKRGGARLSDEGVDRRLREGMCENEVRRSA